MTNCGTAMITSRKPGGTIAIIKSTAFDFEGPNGSFDESLPPGQSFAAFLEQRLIACGARLVSKQVPGEEGWSFDVELHARVYRFFIHWAPIGDPPSDRWIIQTSICKGLLHSLVGGATIERDVSTVLDILHQQMSNASEIEEITWITNEEFSELY